MLDTLIGTHQAVSITAGLQITSLSCRGLVTFQNGRRNGEMDQCVDINSCQLLIYNNVSGKSLNKLLYSSIHDAIS
jgi:hypothetical protein